MKAILGHDQYTCVDFLNRRIKSDNYRGIQITQHNRYNIEIIHIIIEEIYSISGVGLLQIRTTDISKRPQNIKGEEKYASLVINISNRIGRCTQDSLRKNLFVDMHRMGFIERYDSNLSSIDPYMRSKVKYISLTPLAYTFIKTNDIFEKRMIYTKALECLMSGYGQIIANIMVDLERTSITAIDMSLFTSFIDQPLDDKIYTQSEIAMLLKEFYQMSVYEQESIIEQLKTYCDSTMSNKDKKVKRDWHNWLNESQQIMNLLGQTAYFEQCDSKLIIRLTKDGIFAEGRLKRSKRERDEYYIKHNINKKLGFELHHIVPLCWAKNKEQFMVLDSWKNLVYIDAYSHAKITQQRNKNVVLNFSEHNVTFSDFQGNYIECVSDENIIYKQSLQDTMKNYNESILFSSDIT